MHCSPVLKQKGKRARQAQRLNAHATSVCPAHAATFSTSSRTSETSTPLACLHQSLHTRTCSCPRAAVTKNLKPYPTQHGPRLDADIARLGERQLGLLARDAHVGHGAQEPLVHLAPRTPPLARRALRLRQVILGLGFVFSDAGSPCAARAAARSPCAAPAPSQIGVWVYVQRCWFTSRRAQ